MRKMTSVGVVPDFSQKLKLETIDLSDNILSGSLPTLDSLESLTVIFYHLFSFEIVCTKC